MAALLVQGWLGTYFGVAVAAGTKVCSATGASTVMDADGKPLPASAAHHANECCCTPFLGPSLVLPEWRLAHQPGLAPAEPLTLQKLAAQWLAPLSRGPPVHS